jgi:hypothetical protein
VAKNLDRYSVLFALRVLVAWRPGAALIEKGLGATYISVGELGLLQIPLSLASHFPRQFAAYKKAAETESWETLRLIEQRVRKMISRRSQQPKPQEA